MNYYFVGTSLPELKIGEEPEINLAAYEELLRLNLTPKDYEKVENLSVEMRAEGLLGRKIRLVMADLRARKYEREFKIEDEELLSEATDLEHLFEAHSEDPGKLREALLKYRFDKIEEERGLDEFSIDRLLGYMIQLHLVEQSRKDKV